MKTTHYFHHYLPIVVTSLFAMGFFHSARSEETHRPSRKKVVHEFEGRVSAKHLVEFEDYDQLSNSYHVIRPDFPFTRTAWLYTTPQYAAAAIDSIHLESVRGKPESIVGTVYSTDRALSLIPPTLIKKDPRFANVLKKRAAMKDGDP